MKYEVVEDYGIFKILNTEGEGGERIRVSDPQELLGFHWENIDGRFVSGAFNAGRRVPYN